MVKIRRVALRYENLASTALELFLDTRNTQGSWTTEGHFVKGSSSKSLSKSQTSADDDCWFGYANSSILLSFDSTSTRDAVLRVILSTANGPSARGESAAEGTTRIVVDTERSRMVNLYKAWISSAISAYAYLELVNSAAGRTREDLSRYPVFPWVISDYTSHTLDLSNPSTYRDLSKPIGALSPSRLEYFKDRMSNMGQSSSGSCAVTDQPFLYGTHYSTPAYTLYYLVRIMPAHVLCLQGGSYDQPDRTFSSMQDTWRSANENNADLKELIPEFYNVKSGGCGDQGGKFLLNTLNLPLGATSRNGQRIHDVILPKWARSGKDFVRKMRKALESDYCGEHLNEWIDLIFGVSSRGEGRKEKDNIFMKSCYYTSLDIEMEPEQSVRDRMIMETEEFGVTPDLLFVLPHGKRGQGEDEGGIPWEAVVGGDFGGRGAGAAILRGASSDDSDEQQVGWKIGREAELAVNLERARLDIENRQVSERGGSDRAKRLA